MRHKFGKMSNKVLKTVVTDFYSGEALGTAKSMLINDVGKFHRYTDLYRDTGKPCLGEGMHFSSA